MGGQQTSDIREFLGRTPFFGGLTDQALDGVIAMLVRREIAAAGVVFREGEQGSSMYVVAEGELVAAQSGDSGRQVKLMHFRPGDFFGETTLIEMQPRPFTVTALHPAVLLELTNMSLYKLYRQDVHAYVMVLQNINRELCRRLRHASNRLTKVAEFSGDDVTQIRSASPITDRSGR